MYIYNCLIVPQVGKAYVLPGNCRARYVWAHLLRVSPYNISYHENKTEKETREHHHGSTIGSGVSNYISRIPLSAFTILSINTSTYLMYVSSPRPALIKYPHYQLLQSIQVPSSISDISDTSAYRPQTITSSLTHKDPITNSLSNSHRFSKETLLFAFKPNMPLPSQHNLDTRHYHITTTIETQQESLIVLHRTISSTLKQLVHFNSTFPGDPRTCPQWRTFYGGYLDEFTRKLTELENDVDNIFKEGESLIKDIVRVKWATLGYTRMYDEDVVKRKMADLVELRAEVRGKYEEFVGVFVDTFRMR